MVAHIFQLKQTSFVLWRPGNSSIAPKLVIGEFSAGNPPALANEQTFDLALSPGTTDLWCIAATASTRSGSPSRATVPAGTGSPRSWTNARNTAARSAAGTAGYFALRR